MLPQHEAHVDQSACGNNKQLLYHQSWPESCRNIRDNEHGHDNACTNLLASHAQHQIEPGYNGFTTTNWTLTSIVLRMAWFLMWKIFSDAFSWAALQRTPIALACSSHGEYVEISINPNGTMQKWISTLSLLSTQICSISPAALALTTCIRYYYHISSINQGQVQQSWEHHQG